jgi:hypothetical protein
MAFPLRIAHSYAAPYGSPIIPKATCYHSLAKTSKVSAGMTRQCSELLPGRSFSGATGGAKNTTMTSVIEGDSIIGSGAVLAAGPYSRFIGLVVHKTNTKGVHGITFGISRPGTVHDFRDRGQETQ